jgi:predicted dehydrogenase
MEIQVRNWLYYTWLSGDHIVEQHIHNLDVMNWAYGGPPVKALGMGGRQVRTAPEYGNIFDHFSIEYEYANGARVQSFCRQHNGATKRVGEKLVGTNGVSNPANNIEGPNAYKYDGPVINPKVQEHADLIASIRSGNPLNEGRRVAESTLTAIMGRITTYTGREISWNWLMNSSKLKLGPDKYVFGDNKVEPIAIPGKTQLI